MANIWNIKSLWHLRWLFCLSIPYTLCPFLFFFVPWRLPLGVHHWGLWLRFSRWKAGREKSAVFVYCAPSAFQWWWGWPSRASYHWAVTPQSLGHSPASRETVCFPSPSQLWLLKACCYYLLCAAVSPVGSLNLACTSLIGSFLRGPWPDVGAQGRAVLGRVTVEGVATGRRISWVEWTLAVIEARSQASSPKV